MLPRDDEDEPIDAERQHLETGDLDRTRNDPEIRRAVGNGGDDLVAETLLEVHIDLREGGEGGGERIGRGHRHAAARAAPRSAHSYATSAAPDRAGHRHIRRARRASVLPAAAARAHDEPR